MSLIHHQEPPLAIHEVSLVSHADLVARHHHRHGIQLGEGGGGNQDTV